jgi:hypothetical protein
MKTVIAKFVGTVGELKGQVDEVLGSSRRLPVRSESEETQFVVVLDIEHGNED